MKNWDRSRSQRVPSIWLGVKDFVIRNSGRSRWPFKNFYTEDKTLVNSNVYYSYRFDLSDRCKRKVKNFLRKITSFPEDSWLHKKAVLSRTDGSFENYILKSIFGFIGGVILTYIFFMFFVIQLNFSLASATLLCSVIGVILTLGLSFFYGVRSVFASRTYEKYFNSFLFPFFFSIKIISLTNRIIHVYLLFIQMRRISIITPVLF